MTYPRRLNPPSGWISRFLDIRMLWLPEAGCRGLIPDRGSQGSALDAFQSSFSRRGGAPAGRRATAVTTLPATRKCAVFSCH